MVVTAARCVRAVPEGARLVEYRFGHDSFRVDDMNLPVTIAPRQSWHRSRVCFVLPQCASCQSVLWVGWWLVRRVGWRALLVSLKGVIRPQRPG